MRSLSLPNELIQAHLKGQISWSVALELHKLKDANVRQTLLNEIFSRESAPFRWVQQRVKVLKATVSEPARKTKASLSKQLNVIAKRINNTEPRLSQKQRQQIEEILQTLENVLENTNE
ncbi:MAG: hypothetical protein F6K11_09815 [Leptolyngbya sp. SIO3F4]|nr:hypothetical protein [Leptolyngbya sp. SIO3F4]